MAVGQQVATVVEADDAVAQQVPALFGVARHDLGRVSVGRLRGRTAWLVVAEVVVTDALGGVSVVHRPCPSFWVEWHRRAAASHMHYRQVIRRLVVVGLLLWPTRYASADVKRVGGLSRYSGLNSS